MIFVFGSNMHGAHAGGAAREAYDNFQATWGIANGPTGRAYAIPTLDKNMKALPLDEIRGLVGCFLEYARRLPEEEFFVTAIGCGIAGYKPGDIAPMFKDAPQNCTLHRRFAEVLYDV